MSTVKGPRCESLLQLDTSEIMNSGWQNDEEKYELKYKNIAKLLENNALVIMF